MNTLEHVTLATCVQQTRAIQGGLTLLLPAWKAEHGCLAGCAEDVDAAHGSCSVSDG